MKLRLGIIHKTHFYSEQGLEAAFRLPLVVYVRPASRCAYRNTEYVVEYCSTAGKRLIQSWNRLYAWHGILILQMAVMRIACGCSNSKQMWRKRMELEAKQQWPAPHGHQVYFANSRRPVYQSEIGR